MRKSTVGLLLVVAFLAGALVRQAVVHAQTTPSNFTILPIGPPSNCPTIPTTVTGAVCFSTSGIIPQSGTTWAATPLGNGSVTLTLNGTPKTCAPNCSFTITAVTAAPQATSSSTVPTVTAPTVTTSVAAPVTTVTAQ